MREIRNINKKKETPSKFFELFEQKYGSYNTTRATDAEIRKNINRLIKDLVYGNMNNKDMDRLKLDSRVSAQLKIELISLLDRQNLFISLFKDALALKSSSLAHKSFKQYYDEEISKFNIYSCLYHNISMFIATGDDNFIRNIQAQCNTALLNKYRSII